MFNSSTSTLPSFKRIANKGKSLVKLRISVKILIFIAILLIALIWIFIFVIGSKFRSIQPSTRSLKLSKLSTNEKSFDHVRHYNTPRASQWRGLKYNIGACGEKLSSKSTLDIQSKDVLKVYEESFIRKYIDKYNYCTSVPQAAPDSDRSLTLSLTTIPSHFELLKIPTELPKNINIILNVPRDYRFHSYTQEDLQNLQLKYPYLIINQVNIDYGPATKLIGLCEAINTAQIKNNIIYIDDDVVYDVDNLLLMLNYTIPDRIFGKSGGFYLDPEEKIASIGYDLFEWAFRLSRDVFTSSEILYGFGGVSMTKSTLTKVCSSEVRNLVFNCNDCFMIDDEWLSWIYHYLDFEVISSRVNHPVKDVSQSDSNNFSNRMIYKQLNGRCLQCLSKDYENYENLTQSNFQISTFYSAAAKTLHDLKEYTNTVKLFQRNHYIFAIRHNYEYKLYRELKTSKPHWMKIYILQDFLNSCSKDDIMFYTDLDFYFVNNHFPAFHPSKSIIVSRGCDIDYVHFMAGNFLVKCDAELKPFVNIWLEATKLMSESGEFNDDQVAFNLVAPRFLGKFQVEPLMAYDSCPFNLNNIVGIHFPGTDKLQRVMQFKQEFSL